MCESTRATNKGYRHLADSREVGAIIAGVPRRGIQAILNEGHPRRLQNWLPVRAVQAEAQGQEHVTCLGAPRSSEQLPAGRGGAG